MDYDFIDETRPRFQVRSGPCAPHAREREIDRKQVAICAAVALLLFSYCWTLTGLPQFVLLWLALSILIGPFAPLSLTGGDCRVGVGEVLLLEEEKVKPPEAERQKRTVNQFNHGKRFDKVEIVRQSANDNDVENRLKLLGELSEKPDRSSNSSVLTNNKNDGEEGEWTSEDVEFLRRQVAKHPRGTLRRWEVITEAFNDKYTVDSVVKMAKALGQRKPGEDGDFFKFLAQRRNSDRSIISPLSQRWDSEGPNVSSDLLGSQRKFDVKKGESQSISNGHVLQGLEQDKGDWTESEDKALLTALRAFPKDTSLRWDKVAAAIPGRTKPQCFKRFAELRENFRNAKADKSNPIEDLQ